MARMSATPCSAPACPRPSSARGLCHRHYEQWRTHGRLTPEREHSGIRRGAPCGECGAPSSARGLCRRHYDRARRARLRATVPCSAPDCPRGAQARGLCQQHYDRKRRAKAPPCSAPACTVGADARGLCRQHYDRDRARRMRRPTA